jgi:hypothetical protein
VLPLDTQEFDLNSKGKIFWLIISGTATTIAAFRIAAILSLPISLDNFVEPFTWLVVTCLCLLFMSPALVEPHAMIVALNGQIEFRGITRSKRFHLSNILAVDGYETENDSGVLVIDNVRLSFTDGKVVLPLFDRLDDFLVIAQNAKPWVKVDPRLRDHLSKVKTSSGQSS